MKINFLGNIFIFVGNALVLLVIAKIKELRNTTNYFLGALAVADLLFLCICIPPALIQLHTQPNVWIMGYVLCKLIIVPIEKIVAHIF